FYGHQKTKTHIRARTMEGFNKTYGIVHPREQWASNRYVRLSPLFERQKALGAVFFEAMGFERPQWYESNTKLLAKYGEKVMPRKYEWDGRWWSPIINAEHLAMREGVGMVDLSAFAIFDVTGPGALGAMQTTCVARMDVPVGRVVYTSLLNAAGGIKADLTVMRLSHNHFRIVTGVFDGPRDKKWFTDHLPADGSAQLSDVSSAWTTIGVWGPNARKLAQSVTEQNLSNEAFPFGTWQWVDIGPIHAIASRISYVGELGWEIYAPMEQAGRLWDVLWEAGQPHGVVPVGIGVYGTTARLEKCYRLYGAELELEYNLVEAGMVRPQVKPQDFIGKAAYLKQRAEAPAAILCTLTVDDNTAKSGFMRYMQGREPILTPDGKPVVDKHGRGSYVTSAGSGPSVGKTLLMSYLPPEQAKVGAKLVVEYFAEHYPVTVAVVGNKPLFDPENGRMKA
ncbi:MAG TPA: glycine cleavage T C-terminal barrel domain-containing protein, partial [Anaerolineales bacterium]|nr:glycine cleavage T C-terminal barrel domain-containing protein [Anaerolineales bacterium]